jgi:hypothetical protein
LIFSDKNGPIFWKPTDERTPPRYPMKIAAHGAVTISAEEPIATPPASVAFKMSSILSFPWQQILETHTVPMTLPEIARTVLIIVLCWVAPSARAPLKEGQNIQRKIDPIIAVISE